MKRNDNNKVSKVRNFLYEAHFIFFCFKRFSVTTPLPSQRALHLPHQSTSLYKVHNVYLHL